MKTLQVDGREVTVVWMPYNWGYKGPFDRPEREPPHDRCCRSWRGNPRDQGLPGQCDQGARPPVEISEAREGNVMTQLATPSSHQDDAGRHHEMHRLSRVSSCLQAVERSRGGRDRVGFQPGLSEPRHLSAKTLTLITFHEIPDEKAPGGLALPFHHAALSALLRASVRLSLPDDGPGPESDGPVTLRCQQMHRLPLLHLGLPLGRAHSGMGLARSENTEVYPLCGPVRPACSPGPQWAGTQARGEASCSAKTLSAGLRQGLPG